MSQFEGKTLTALCCERNAIKRELYLYGDEYSESRMERVQGQIAEYQAEIDRREREGLDERLQ